MIDVFVLQDRTAELVLAQPMPTDESALGEAEPMAATDDVRSDSPHAPGAWSGGYSLQRGVGRLRWPQDVVRLRRCSGGAGHIARVWTVRGSTPQRGADDDSEALPHGAVVPLASGIRQMPGRRESAVRAARDAIWRRTFRYGTGPEV
jgi:hypothetical protein